ncbi:hypothetical protein HK096_002643 [Nowakowskiella sp. JEL0078]|nr:hypothetical protein HK096_002643 [Nowakowskiella sp. JEL0078]
MSKRDTEKLPRWVQVSPRKTDDLFELPENVLHQKIQRSANNAGKKFHPRARINQNRSGSMLQRSRAYRHENQQVPFHLLKRSFESGYSKSEQNYKTNRNNVTIADLNENDRHRIASLIKQLALSETEKGKLQQLVDTIQKEQGELRTELVVSKEEGIKSEQTVVMLKKQLRDAQKILVNYDKNSRGRLRSRSQDIDQGPALFDLQAELKKLSDLVKELGSKLYIFKNDQETSEIFKKQTAASSPEKDMKSNSNIDLQDQESISKISKIQTDDIISNNNEIIDFDTDNTESILNSGTDFSDFSKDKWKLQNQLEKLLKKSKENEIRITENPEYQKIQREIFQDSIQCQKIPLPISEDDRCKLFKKDSEQQTNDDDFKEICSNGEAQKISIAIQCSLSEPRSSSSVSEIQSVSNSKDTSLLFGNKSSNIISSQLQDPVIATHPIYQNVKNCPSDQGFVSTNQVKGEDIAVNIKRKTNFVGFIGTDTSVNPNINKSQSNWNLPENFSNFLLADEKCFHKAESFEFKEKDAYEGLKSFNLQEQIGLKDNSKINGLDDSSMICSITDLLEDIDTIPAEGYDSLNTSFQTQVATRYRRHFESKQGLVDLFANHSKGAKFPVQHSRSWADLERNKNEDEMELSSLISSLNYS